VGDLPLDPDVVLACVRIPPGAQGWRPKNATSWSFRDARDGSLGAPGSKDAVTVKLNAKKQRYDVKVTIANATVGTFAAGEVSAQLGVGGQGWELRQPWRLAKKERQLVTP
jgi:hypothetical protein